ncbi:DUF3006 family protein [Halapricum salinum]|uniref:DUF3006 domain-containing protein n=1 Tax=Halapricum salinum TaxID=1457250 RepID=A0A4D6HDU9_9EURY|nr:DUF3006 family protein [Halapricum salinum]QCC51426.1 DUF3006 domain-containing protein [Halapricum salinum]
MTDITTLPDGEYTAVVDTVEDGLATVFFEQHGDEVGDAVLEASILPEDARHADAVLTVKITNGNLLDAEYDPDQSKERADKAQSRFDRLSKRPPSDKDT